MAKRLTPADKMTKARQDMAAAAVLSTSTRQVDELKRTIAKLGAAREEAVAGERKVEEAASGLSHVAANLSGIRDEISIHLVQIESLIDLARQGGRQGGYVADKLGDVEEGLSDLLNDAIDNVIRLSDSDLSDQSESRLRDALEGALERPLKAALSGLTQHRRRMVMEIIIQSMIEEAEAE